MLSAVVVFIIKKLQGLLSKITVPKGDLNIITFLAATQVNKLILAELTRSTNLTGTLQEQTLHHTKLIYKCQRSTFVHTFLSGSMLTRYMCGMQDKHFRTLS